MPPSTGSEPPDRLVPLPRATNGTRSRWQRRTVSTTSSRVSGSTTASGRRRKLVRASDSYGATRAGSVNSLSAGYRPRSPCNSSATATALLSPVLPRTLHLCCIFVASDRYLWQARL